MHNCVAITCAVGYTGKAYSEEDDLCPDCRDHECHMGEAHNYVEAVDEDGQLIEPAYDICTNCGAIQP
jgi:hypothetical protein